MADEAMGEPDEVAMTPALEIFLMDVSEAFAAGDEVRVAGIVDAATDEQRAAFLAWARRRMWLESEVMSAEEGVRQVTAQLAALDRDLAAATEAELCGCSLYVDVVDGEDVVGSARVVHECGRG